LFVIAFVLWISIALCDACTATSPALGARQGGDQGKAVEVDSNASFAGQVERNVRRGSDFSRGGKFRQTPPYSVSAKLPASHRKMRIPGEVARATMISLSIPI
jgi:hypothetical protein